jgi:hypothetical protein
MAVIKLKPQQVIDSVLIEFYIYTRCFRSWSFNKYDITILDVINGTSKLKDYKLKKECNDFKQLYER